MPDAVLWLRRDLRLSDHPALLAAHGDGGRVVPLFVLDDALRGPAGAPRLAFLYRTLRAVHEDTDGALVVRTGRPEDVVPAVAAEAGADRVHVSADFGPYGVARDARVTAALRQGDRELVATGSPYAVSPGRLRELRVFSAYLRSWLGHGVRPPAGPQGPPRFRRLDGEAVPADPDLGPVTGLPAAGEAAAAAHWAAYRGRGLRGYAATRDIPGAAGTSELSVYLKYGCIHPRTLLAGLGEGAGAAAFRTELAWRDFYADVLFRHPGSARHALAPQLAGLRTDSGPAADRLLAAWAAGRTGYPVVDAGMRQLATEAWMHNRVRMIAASFLVKDLHLPWQRGAALFMQRLRDGDLASNMHGWQWVAGTGTDPAPFFRVFNPVLQGRKFDPAGDYVRRYVPELAGVPDRFVHEPWRCPGGPPAGYPAPVVDHAEERVEALRRYADAKA